MCIIIAKDKMDRLPTKKELATSFAYNKDGAGFMYTDKGKVIIDKGYMNYIDFINRYDYLCKKYDNFNDKSLVMHFRIGTDGSNSAKNTHPYAMTNSLKKLHKLYTKTNIGIAHNGIISDYKPFDSKIDTNDTQNFIKYYLYNKYKQDKEFYKRDWEQKRIEDITWSKFAILDKDDNLYTIGNFVEDKGLKFSNDSYKPYSERSYVRYSGYDKYKWGWDC